MSEPAFHADALRLFALLRRKDRAKAKALICRSLQSASIEFVHLKIMLPVIGLAGAAASRGEIPAGKSQAIFAEIHDLLADIRRRMTRSKELGLKTVIVGLPGEMHGAGLKLIGDWLWRDGWTVAMPPLDTSEAGVIQFVERQRPDMLALSCSLPRQAATARRIIRHLRAAEFTRPIWIGGMAINAYPELFPRTLADDTAPNIVDFSRRLATQFGYSTATPPDL